jgi:hypothetical protein
MDWPEHNVGIKGRYRLSWVVARLLLHLPSNSDLTFEYSREINKGPENRIHLSSPLTSPACSKNAQSTAAHAPTCTSFHPRVSSEKKTEGRVTTPNSSASLLLTSSTFAQGNGWQTNTEYPPCALTRHQCGKFVLNNGWFGSGCLLQRMEVKVRGRAG